jgi:hypothetical protein
MILIDRKTFTITPILGVGEYQVITNNSILVQLIVKPTTSTTTFDVVIEDEDSNEIYKKIDYQGKLNETDISLPSGGNWMVKIQNASVDEAFGIVLGLRRS